ncbi:hypothetical protein ACUN24_21880 [Pedobacter sp. WC2501]|uniref:hypothetical protein n=1 Tax=Pedobacter sp. WC2501 TaxID=3461400 RepID=UPI0040455096
MRENDDRTIASALNPYPPIGTFPLKGKGLKNKLLHTAICPCNTLLAICTSLSGLADFRRKKHGNLCSPPHNPTAQGRIKAGALGISKGESLDAAAIKISVGFYKNCVAIFYTYKNQYNHIKNGCKPFSYAFSLLFFNGRHAFAALRFVTFSSRKK